MATHTLSVTVGTHPNEPDTEISLSEDALSSGCYLGGNHPERQTALLHDWCVQWAERGHGFCYVHPRGPAPRELLARLPEHRLDDVVWIDFRRSRQPDSLDVPPVRRVGVDPFAGAAPDIDADELLTDPVAGRCADWLAACKAGRDVDWNAARALATLLPLAIRHDGLTGRELREALWAAHSDSERVDTLTEQLAPGARFHLEHAVELDADVLRTLTFCLGDPLDSFPSNPLNGASTYPIEDTVPTEDIILVTGSLPKPSAYGRNSIDTIGTYLLILTVVRRLWEGAQQRPSDWTNQMPLVLDRVTDCSPGDDRLLPELIRGAADAALVPILSGPETGELPRRLRMPVTGAVDARVQFIDPTAPGTTPLPDGDSDAMEQAIDREQAHAIDSAPRCWVSTGNAGRLSGKPHAEGTTRPAHPGDPPRTRHGAAAIGTAITESVTRHGKIPDWATEDLLQEGREE
ncbi:hypothetical protein [Haloglomus halophilum]|uniref:hypothetical protein n=1 Tax=Haloglomus halophilum TaxID=2962672 RepID=UPI0020C9D022|nr:hypothetical protein [Haloglomus halophilum]